MVQIMTATRRDELWLQIQRLGQSDIKVQHMKLLHVSVVLLLFFIINIVLYYHPQKKYT